MKIRQDLRPILGADAVSVGMHGTVSLHGRGGVQCNVARSFQGVLKVHPDMDGRERSAEWKAALERALICPEGWDS